jgi:deoxyribodipyrimidine photo-lyase
VVLEALRSGYQWASDRHHVFIIEGMRDNAKRFETADVLYYPYLEPKPDDGKGLLAALGEDACIIVTDDFPEFFLPRMIAAAASQLSVLLEKVDSNGLLPMRAADHAFPTAYSFRRFLQKTLPAHLAFLPEPDPLAGTALNTLKSLPTKITSRWPKASVRLLKADTSALSSFPIDHIVKRTNIRGGPMAAQMTLKRFLEDRLPSYTDLRNHPDEDATSGLSPYLHYGQISVHQVFHDLMAQEGWTAEQISPTATGARQGWWGTGESAEAFLDELVTWRELGYNMCLHRSDYDRYESLPDWAQKTLEEHVGDSRSYIYTLDDFEHGRTHDSLWNAAQKQLLLEGRIHNYLRMLWGKKILEWSKTPREALEIMIHLNNKYGLDGRDPNSYSGVFWVLGRYDRAWGPERPIFGKIRYMSSENTARKVHLRDYLKRYGA